MSGFQYEIKDEAGTRFIEITGYDGSASKLFIPETLEDLPVRRIGKFAFSGREELEEVHLPRNLRTLGLFAFQNCTGLQSMELYNTTDDYYDGVIRACTALKDVTVHCVLPDHFVLVREMLQDTDAALRFHLLLESEAPAAWGGGGAAAMQDLPLDRAGSGDTTLQEMPRLDLTFPEYVSEAQEDTMARAIHFSIEGAGMAYRECVSKKSIDLTAYDRLLERLTEYDFEAAADICFGRLLFPRELSAASRQQYEDYLRSHAAKALEKAVREQRIDEVQYMTAHKLIPDAALDAGLKAASDAGNTQICGILMAYQAAQHRPSGGQKLSLDW